MHENKQQNESISCPTLHFYGRCGFRIVVFPGVSEPFENKAEKKNKELKKTFQMFMSKFIALFS